MSEQQPIPEDIQSNIRARLRLAREARGISKVGAEWACASTLNTWENRDCSSIRLRDLYIMSQALGWNLMETLAYISDNSPPPESSQDRSWRRMSIYLRSLSPELAEAACDIVERLVTFSGDHLGGITRKVVHAGGPLRQNPKQRAQAALRMADD